MHNDKTNDKKKNDANMLIYWIFVMCQDSAKCFTYLISRTDNLQAGTIPNFTVEANS